MPKVSVCMIAYNQEKYIAKAIESVLMQKTNFDYELVIGEDCSTDKTKQVIIKYQNRYQNKIKAIINKKNLGMVPNFIQTLRVCSGQYIALLEGDDYWTSPNKLQKQVDFLDINQDYTISSHNVYVMQEGSKSQPSEWLGRKHKEISTLEDILEYGSGGATCSLVFRRKSIIPLPKWFYTLPGGDWALQVLCTSKGKMYYFSEVMGVYRTKHSNNSLSTAIRQALEKGEETIGLPYKNTLKVIDIFDQHFKYRYSKLLKNQEIYAYYNLAHEYKQNKEFIKARYYALNSLKEIFGWYPYLSPRRIIELIKIVLISYYENSKPPN